MDSFDFSDDWFSGNISPWSRLFSEFLPNAAKILEIGSYEGRSMVWLAEHALARRGGQIVCIDTWSGGEEHDAARMADVEARFDRNRVSAEVRFPGLVTAKRKGRSHPEMIKLLAEGHGESFDFIYVDASHQAPDVLSDLVLAMMLCRPGGVIACDDYLWGEGSENILHRPKAGIDAFTNCFAGKVKVLYGFPLYQLYLMKLSG